MRPFAALIPFLIIGCADTSPCDSERCSDHGTCQTNDTIAICICDPGFHAADLSCIPDTDPCAGIDCGPGGSCTAALCTCGPGYVRTSSTTCSPDGSDREPPSVPTGFTASALSAYQVQLTWSPATDNEAVTGYRVFRDTNAIGTTTTESYLNGGLAPETTYTFTVAAFDAAANTSDLSTPASVTTPADTAASALATLAASMSSGSWQELQTTGLDDGAIFITDDNGSILEYNNEATWDPVGRRIFVVGTARGASAGYGMDNQKWVQWSETTNTWTRLPQLPFYLGFHSYDHAALDTRTGDYYLRVVGSDEVQRFAAHDSTWSQLPPIPLSYASCCNALEYFPDIDSIVFTRGSSDGDTEIFRFDNAQRQWRRMAQGTSMPMGNYHDFAEYSTVHQILFFGGGDVYQIGTRDELYYMDSSGVVTPCANAPLAYDVASALTVTEPTSGNLLLFPESTPDVFHEYVVASDTWLTHTMPARFSVNNQYGLTTVATAIPEYGVVMFLKEDGASSQVMLYKH